VQVAVAEWQDPPRDSTFSRASNHRLGWPAPTYGCGAGRLASALRKRPGGMRYRDVAFESAPTPAVEGAFAETTPDGSPAEQGSEGADAATDILLSCSFSAGELGSLRRAGELARGSSNDTDPHGASRS